MDNKFIVRSVIGVVIGIAAAVIGWMIGMPHYRVYEQRL